MPWVTLETLSNGNCAYNAFLEALVRELKRIVNKVTSDRTADEVSFYNEFLNKKEFLTAAAVELGFHADHVIQEICELHDKSPAALARALGGVMRHLSIELIKNSPDDDYLLLTEERLIGAFNHPEADDIFTVHPEIRAQFKIAHSKNDPENDLRDWWRSTGYAVFLKNMQNLEKKYWAGDLELSILAKYFGVNLDIKLRNTEKLVSAHAEHGNFSLDGISYSTANQLVRRGILDGRGLTERSYDDYDALPCQLMIKEVFLHRTGPVCEDPKVQALLLEYFELHEGNLKKTAVPKWDHAILEELQARGVIQFSPKNNGYCFTSNFAESPNPGDRSLDELKALIGEVSNKAQLIKTWQKDYKNPPTLVLTNPNAVHWSSMRWDDGLNRQQEPKATSTDLVLSNHWAPLKNLFVDLKPKDCAYSIEAFVRKHGTDFSNPEKIVLKKIKLEADMDLSKSEAYVTYDFDGKSVVVDRFTQEVLDLEFAKELQLKENKQLSTRPSTASQSGRRV